MSNATKQPTAEERVEASMENRLAELTLLWELYNGVEVEEQDNPDGFTEDSLHEYGLAFDYVAPGTFGDQEEPYWRYQISWGGPSEEIRFYSGGPDQEPYKVEYWFLDWYDGAHRNPTGDDLEICMNLWRWFSETETTAHVQKEATE